MESWEVRAIKIFAQAPIQFAGWQDMLRDYLNEFAVPLLMAKNLPEPKRSRFMELLRQSAEEGGSVRHFEDRYPPAVYDYDEDREEVIFLNQFSDLARSALLSRDFEKAFTIAQETLDYINSLSPSHAFQP